ncbi:MAG: hypothetical protein ACTSRH_19315, partial [Promethearchaeota archaeon]
MIWILMILVISYSLNYLQKKRIGYLKYFLNCFGIIGVCIHEFSHYFISLLCGISIKRFKIEIIDNYTHQISPGGFVEPKKHANLTFFKALLISFAPLFISIILLFGCIDLIFNIDNYYLRIILFLIAFSITYGASPSNADIKIVLVHFKKNVKKSVVQLTSLIISITIILFFSNLNIQEFPLLSMFSIAILSQIFFLTLGLYLFFRLILKLINLKSKNSKKFIKNGFTFGEKNQFNMKDFSMEKTTFIFKLFINISFEFTF